MPPLLAVLPEFEKQHQKFRDEQQQQLQRHLTRRERILQEEAEEKALAARKRQEQQQAREARAERRHYRDEETAAERLERLAEDRRTYMRHDRASQQFARAERAKDSQAVQTQLEQATASIADKLAELELKHRRLDQRTRAAVAATALQESIAEEEEIALEQQRQQEHTTLDQPPDENVEECLERYKQAVESNDFSMIAELQDHVIATYPPPEGCQNWQSFFAPKEIPSDDDDDYWEDPIDHATNEPPVLSESPLRAYKTPEDLFYTYEDLNTQRSVLQELYARYSHPFGVGPEYLCTIPQLAAKFVKHELPKYAQPHRQQQCHNATSKYIREQFADYQNNLSQYKAGFAAKERAQIPIISKRLSESVLPHSLLAPPTPRVHTHTPARAATAAAKSLAGQMPPATIHEDLQSEPTDEEKNEAAAAQSQPSRANLPPPAKTAPAKAHSRAPPQSIKAKTLH
jgi:hypothetical protein